MNASHRLPRSMPCLHGRTWLCTALTRLLAASLLLAGVPAESQPRQAEQGQVRNASPSLVLGKPARAGKDQVTVAVHFSPAKEGRVGQIRAEVILPEGPWQFRKIEVAKRSSLKGSARLRREEKPDSQGNRHRVSVVLLSFSAGRNAIAGGQIAQLYFSVERPDSPISIPLAVRTFQTGPPEPQVARDEPILEPPPADPPMNPAPTCFFFAH